MTSFLAWNYISTALLYHLPQLVICVVALVMGAIYHSRVKAAAILAIVGATISLISILGPLAVTALMLESGGTRAPMDGIVMQANNWAGIVGRAIGMACFVGGIFVGRVQNEPMPMYGPPGQGYPPQKPMQ